MSEREPLKRTFTIPDNIKVPSIQRLCICAELFEEMSIAERHATLQWLSTFPWDTQLPSESEKARS